MREQLQGVPGVLVLDTPKFEKKNASSGTKTSLAQMFSSATQKDAAIAGFDMLEVDTTIGLYSPVIHVWLYDPFRTNVRESFETVLAQCAVRTP